MKKPRLIAFMPCSVSLRGETAKIPSTEVMTPTARTNNGNITPMIGLIPMPLAAAAPRMIEATSVTS